MPSKYLRETDTHPDMVFLREHNNEVEQWCLSNKRDCSQENIEEIDHFFDILIDQMFSDALPSYDKAQNVKQVRDILDQRSYMVRTKSDSSVLMKACANAERAYVKRMVKKYGSRCPIAQRKLIDKEVKDNIKTILMVNTSRDMMPCTRTLAASYGL